MNPESRMLRYVSLLAALALVFLVPSVGASDEEYLTVEQYIEIARPYLHLSCEGAWELAEEDADAYVDIINKVSAIGFINHDFDVNKLGELDPADLEARQIDFYTATGELCKENPKDLLAGVVEKALVDAFLEIQPNADDM